MREVAVLGVGMTKFGVSEKTQLEMFGEAAMDAINESNIKLTDIQQVLVGSSDAEISEGQHVIASMCAGEIGLAGLPATRFEGACAGSMMAIRDAFMWVASGFYDFVLAGGTERQQIMGTSLATRVMNMGMHSTYESPTGLTFPGIFAMMAHLYAHKYGIPLPQLKEAMARVAIKNHKNATHNPKAHFQKEISLWDAFSAMMVSTPLQLYDCCPMSDGAAAVVIAPLELARKLVKKPVVIAGVGQSSAASLCSQKDIARVSARENSSRQAYKMAGLTPKDIDLAEVHDCFTIAEIVATEGLGFFDFGDGWKAVERGDTQIGGKIPINPSGGLKAKGHPVGATGAAQAYEVVKQIRGECGERQVEGAKIGMTDTIGGTLASIGNCILKRGW
ncbi:MAG: propanoyl-CoA acyltransferase [Chloroflexota bacterium]